MTMFALIWRGYDNSVRYDSAAEAWRAAHELLEEAFGENYGADELAEYDVIAA